MKELENPQLEFEIFEAFQKTEAYKTITKGKDVFPFFRMGFMACYYRPTQVMEGKNDGPTRIPELPGNSIHLTGFR